MNANVDPTDLHHLSTSALAIEQALIGTCSMSAAALSAAQSLILPEHLSEPIHQVLWSTMTEMAADGRTVNPITITARLGNSDVGGIKLKPYVAQCAADTTCPPAHVAEFAKQVREYWCLRQVIADVEDARAAAILPGCDARGLVAELMQRLDAARAVVDTQSSGPVAIGSVTADVIDRMNRMLVGEVIDSLVTTGLRDLDNRLGGGLAPGDLVIMAGRPGMGKTTLAASIARHAARAGHAGAFFSLEMPRRQIGARLIADEAFSGEGSVTAGQILKGQVDEQRALHIIDAERLLRTLPLIIDASSSLTVGEVAARTRNIADRFRRAGKRLEFIVIDYLKFLRASDRYRGQRVLEIGEITGGLKGLAKDLGIVVVLLAQLNREVEKTADKRPDLAHLRDSGEIEQDADVVMLLFREAYYLSSDPELIRDKDKYQAFEAVKRKLEIIIAKHRMGQTCALGVYFHDGASAVRDMARV